VLPDDMVTSLRVGDVVIRISSFLVGFPYQLPVQNKLLEGTNNGEWPLQILERLETDHDRADLYPLFIGPLTLLKEKGNGFKNLRYEFVCLWTCTQKISLRFTHS
jgi:hypothetical protein